MWAWLKAWFEILPSFLQGRKSHRAIVRETSNSNPSTPVSPLPRKQLQLGKSSVCVLYYNKCILILLFIYFVDGKMYDLNNIPKVSLLIFN